MGPAMAEAFDTVDGFYRAALGEASWAAGLRALRADIGGHRACIIRATPAGLANISCQGDDAELVPPGDVALYLADPLARRERRMAIGQVYSWDDIVDLDALRRRPFWRQVLGPLGLHRTLSCRLSGDMVLHLTREEGAGGFAAAERAAFARLMPHVLRAGEVERRLARPGPGGTATLITDADGQVLWASPAGEAWLTGASDGLAGVPNLLPHLARLCRADPGAGGPVPVRGPKGELRALLHLSPLPRGTHYGFATPRAVLITVEALDSRPEVEAAIRGQFALTPAEARLAARLAEGHSLRRAAEAAGIGFGTARNYLLRIFRKTGAARQADLVTLLRAVPPR